MSRNPQRSHPHHLPIRMEQEHGPFDIIGDVHGCGDELEELLGKLGYTERETRPGLGLDSGPVYEHPAGRKAVFLGDLVDRGPRILDVLRIVHNMFTAKTGLSVTGNHDDKLLRLLRGRNVQLKHGLETTVAQLEDLPGDVKADFKHGLEDFLGALNHHLILDDGHLVVAHAGLKESLQGKPSDRTRSFALYGDTTGQTDEYGLPIRRDWAARYAGKALVVYGHTPVPEPKWSANAVNVDTGCIFGGHLTALRYPEREIVSVPAHRVYYESARPFPPNRKLQGAHVSA